VGRMKVWTDGGSRGNPGPSAWAFVTDTGHSEGGFLGLMFTNNEAEYTAMMMAITYLLNIAPEEKHQIYTDSRLLEGQLMCNWKMKAKNLTVPYSFCKAALETSLSNSHVYYVPREQNKEADRLVNEVLDAQENGK
jgi:ribonuclease HI